MLFLFLVVLSFLSVFLVRYAGVSFFPISITGYAVNDSGIVQFFVGDIGVVTIHSPENTTYYFDMLDVLLVDLNVSADFTVIAVNGFNLIFLT